MAEDLSFTDIGGRKKVRKVKRKRSKNSTTDPAKLLDEVIRAKKLADKSLSSLPVDQFSVPFIEFSVHQSNPFKHGNWNGLEISLSNTGTGEAKNVTISFDRFETKGQTIVDSLKSGDESKLNIEALISSRDKEITRMEVYYHSIEGDTFSAIRRDWFPNNYEDQAIFSKEIPPGEEANAEKYSRKEVFSGDLHIVCGNCGTRAPSNFRICGKCGSRLQKRVDRRSDWGSNLNETTAKKDDREAFIKKLRKLGELKDKGMLSDAEFQAAKESLLK